MLDFAETSGREATLGYIYPPDMRLSTDSNAEIYLYQLIVKLNAATITNKFPNTGRMKTTRNGGGLRAAHLDTYKSKYQYTYECAIKCQYTCK